MWCFAGVFERNGCFKVVLWWSICGGLRGECGSLAATFWVARNVTGICDLFFEVSHFGKRGMDLVWWCDRAPKFSFCFGGFHGEG